MMWIRSSASAVLVVLLLAAILSQGCGVVVKAIYNEEIETALDYPDGVVAPLFTIQREERGPRIVAGTIHLVGKFTPEETNAAGATGLPPVGRIFLRRTDATGQVLVERAFDLHLKRDGVIPLQVFAIPDLLITPGEQLAIAFQPLGGHVPPGRIRFRLRYDREAPESGAE